MSRNSFWKIQAGFQVKLSRPDSANRVVTGVQEKFVIVQGIVQRGRTQ